jgi:ribosomal protein L11 methyltransferase
MNFIRITFRDADEQVRAQLTAMMSMTFEMSGFEEDDANNLLIAYTEEEQFRPEEMAVITGALGIGFDTELVPHRNWNEEWEKNFEPVVIDGFCSVRADFHPKPEDVAFDIVITPKMSFGTGHHATTALMMTFMRDLDFKGKRVFDFGTGTGILAILAVMLGASDVLAIDNDEWSVSNALESCERNGTANIAIQLGTIELVDDSPAFDIILANINRHILLADMNHIEQRLAKGGTLLLSGILPEDRDIIDRAATDAGLIFVAAKTDRNWLCMQYRKEQID